MPPIDVKPPRRHVAKPEPPRPRTLSPAGTLFIARFEGFSARLYNDAASNATIGYGHLVHYGPINGHELPLYRRGLDHAQALELLRQDAGAAALAVRELVHVRLTQPQFDALCSFAFYCGSHALAESTLLRKLNAGDYAAVPAELAKWVQAGGRTLPGLVARRHAEGVLFAHGTY